MSLEIVHIYITLSVRELLLKRFWNYLFVIIWKAYEIACENQYICLRETINFNMILLLT